MKKIMVATATLIILFTVLGTPVQALSNAQSVAIQKLLDDACRISGVPGTSVSIILGDETCYFSAGYAESYT